MAVREILHFPDPRLRVTARPVECFDPTLATLARDLADTMYAHSGVGLAATQVGEALRVVVLDTSETRDQLLTLVNPELIHREGAREHEEGCLSVPDIFEVVERAARVQVRAQDLAGADLELEAEGLLGVCLQHEIEHLDGKLFIDRLSRLKQDRIRKRAVKRGRHDRLETA